MNDWKSEYIKKIDCSNIDDVDAKGAEALRVVNLPKRLYKYRAVNDGSLDNFANDTVWLNNPSKYNDPFEFAEYVNPDVVLANMLDETLEKFKEEFFKPPFPEEIKEQIENSDSPNKAFLEFLRTADAYKDIIDTWEDGAKGLHQSLIEKQNGKINFLQNILTVCSFCESPSELLMWSHYTDCYKGFCVEYDIEKWPKNDIRNTTLYPVIYQSEIYDATIHLKNLFETETFNVFYGLITGTTKAVQWEYEKEWRFIKYDGAPKNYKMDCQTKVFLGFRMPETHMNQILEICKSKNIEAYWAKPLATRYAVGFTKIEL